MSYRRRRLLAPGFSGSVPINIVLPATPTGTVTDGQTLTSPSLGTWIGATPISYARQWFHADPVYDGNGDQVFDGNGDAVFINEADIAGETGATYVLDAGDVGMVVGVRVTATNGRGSNSAESFVTGVVTAAVVPGGRLDFHLPVNSGLLVLLEDI